MKVRIIVGAQAAYACIETKTNSMDIKLSAGRSAEQSLREFAFEQQEKAARAIRYATLALEAALVLEKEKESARSQSKSTTVAQRSTTSQVLRRLASCASWLDQSSRA